MALTRQALPKLVLAVVAAAAAVLLLRCLLFLAALRRQGADGAVVVPVAWLAAAFALAAALPLAALALPAGWRANVALTLASAVTAAYAVEVALSLRADGPERRLHDALRVVEDMRRAGQKAYLPVDPVRLVWARPPDAPSALTIDGRPTLPLAGRALTRLVSCQDETRGGWRVYETDEHGFLNPPGSWQRPPVTLAAVGDSFTAGLCVAQEASMVARLRRRFPDAMNLGVGGNGPLLTLAVVREYLPALRPHRVIWCHFAGNDLRDLRREKGHELLRRYLEDGFHQGLLDRQQAMDRSLDDYRERELQPVLQRQGNGPPPAADILALRELRGRAGLVFSDLPLPTDDEYALFRTVLQKARETVAAWDGRLHFVYLPAGTPRLIGRAAADAVEAKVRARTLSVVRELGLPVIDVQAAFAIQPDRESLFACPECHYTEAGYGVAADAILAGLEGTASP